MKHLIMTILLGLSAICAPVVSAVQQESRGPITGDSGIERTVRCYWAAAGIDVTQSDETDTSSEEEDEEPDCE